MTASIPAVAALVAAIDSQDCQSADHIVCGECAGRVIAAMETAGFLVVAQADRHPDFYMGRCRRCASPEEGSHKVWCALADQTIRTT